MTGPEGWTRRTPADWPELKESPRAVIAQWVGEVTGHELVLYEDGQFDGTAVPIELIRHVEMEWLFFLRGRIA